MGGRSAALTQIVPERVFSLVEVMIYAAAGLTISFSDEIPVFSGNEISFRNFGKFRRISVNFGRNLLNFEFENEIYRKIPKFLFPVTSGNEKKNRNFGEIPPKN